MQVSLPAASSGWDVGLYCAIGLETLLENDAVRIGTRAQYPGNALGTGVTAAAARELGLAPGTAVATSLIDAEAGWLGSIRCQEGDQTQRPAEDRASARRTMGARVAVICGSSICQMWQAPWRCLVPGPVTQGAVSCTCTLYCTHMFITFLCSLYNVYYTAITQQMDNVALSCLLAMAIVAVSYCCDGLCRTVDCGCLWK